MTEIESHKEKSVSEVDPQSTKITRVPQYRRDVFPINTVLSAEDLAEFNQLISEANERAKNIEFNNFDLTKFESTQQARSRVNDLMPIEYT